VESDFDFSVESRLVHGGTERADGAPLGPPLTLTSVYVSQGEPGDGPGYGRNGNPGWAAVESALAAMEGAGAMAVTFASGQAASMALMLALAEGRETIVFPADGYYNTRALAGRLRPHGARAVAVDLLDLDAVAGALRAGPAVLWAETPTNPLLGIADIRALAEAAHEAGALLVVDNTFASPYLQQPLALGADVVVHSTTKYLGGHSDVVGGALVVADPELAERLAFTQNATGGVAGPFDSWLTLRGVKTLAARMDRHCRNAMRVAQMLAEHPAVSEVLYPGLPSHPGHKTAQEQMRAFGGMVSFRLLAGEEAAVRACGRTRLFTLGESLGGVESLIEHPARMTHASVTGSPLEVPGDLIRLSVGIEDCDDLLDDLRQALSNS
jgi:cystathionine gamma-synthase